MVDMWHTCCCCPCCCQGSASNPAFAVADSSTAKGVWVEAAQLAALIKAQQHAHEQQQQQQVRGRIIKPIKVSLPLLIGNEA